MRVANVKIGTRLGGAFFIILVFMLTLGGVAVYRLQQLQQEVEVLVTEEYAKAATLKGITDNLNIVARAMRNTLLVESAEEAAKEAKRVTAARDQVSANLERLAKMM